MKKKPRLSTITSIKNVPRSAPTPFTQKVYEVVCKIPKGQTRSYKWVAQKIGSPMAYRAVGNALKKNPYIGIVPCHRVIKSDGSLGGFSRGAHTKKRLLIQEKTGTHPVFS